MDTSVSEAFVQSESARDNQVKNLVQAIGNSTRGPTDQNRVSGRDTSGKLPDSPSFLDVAFERHQRAAEKFAAEASKLLSAPVEMQVTSIDTVSRDCWQQTLAYPACVAKSMTTLASVETDDDQTCSLGRGILHIEARLAFSIIDRMLGGTPQMNDWVDRELTPIESGLLQRMTSRFAPIWFDECWDVAQNATTNASFERPTRQATSPMSQTADPASEKTKKIGPSSMIRVGITFSLLGVRGNWTCLMPASKFSGWPTTASPTAGQANVVVEINHSNISAETIARLRQGDLLQLDHDVFEDVDVVVDDDLRWKATLGRVGDRKAVKIDRDGASE